MAETHQQSKSLEEMSFISALLCVHAMHLQHSSRASARLWCCPWEQQGDGDGRDEKLGLYCTNRSVISPSLPQIHFLSLMSYDEPGKKKKWPRQFPGFGVYVIEIKQG